MNPSNELVEDVPLMISGLALGNLDVGLGAYTYRIIVGLLRRAPQLRFRVIVPAHFDLPPEIPEALLVRLTGKWNFGRPLLNSVYWSNRILSYAARLSRETVFHSPAPIAGLHRPPTTVVTIHDCLYRTFEEYYGRSFVRKWNLLASERFATRSALVLTQSQFSRRDLVAKTSIPEAKIRILSPWVDQSFLERARPERIADLRNRLGLPPRFWLYLGGFDRRKNVEFLIRAYAAAQKEHSLPPLVLAGEIPSEGSAVTCNVLGALRATKLKSADVLMPGKIAIADLPDLYRAASLLVYPSLMEGFGLPPAEAMAVGTAVLASNNSSLPEVVQDPRCLFDASNEGGLVEKLLLAAEDETAFCTPLSPVFTEPFGIDRYCQLIQDTCRQSERA